MEASADSGRSLPAMNSLQITVLVGGSVRSLVIFVTVVQVELNLVRNIRSGVRLLCCCLLLELLADVIFSVLRSSW